MSNLPDPLQDGHARLDSAGHDIPLEIAASRQARTRGLLGRTGFDGAILLAPSSSVHSLRMRFAIDVAYVDKTLTVIDVRTMKPNRVGVPRVRARYVLEAAAGAMASWGIGAGTSLSIGVAPVPAP
ncbi:DUF192 domain-containing protein [Streptomyces sp. NBC_01465]|uniref:DUF192 domain-containing protein n=1 Tax=Streptomyces sp. NBC_01465 TaxID=2903878 RepID=UPI002E35D57A|nr:DUF192 domain-containing protein [Streptomyces sp. NBC_01465]